jgi:hypothetical protein
MEHLKKELVESALENFKEELKNHESVHAEGFISLKLNNLEAERYLYRELPPNASSSSISRNGRMAQNILDHDDFNEEINFIGNDGKPKSIRLNKRAVYTAQNNGSNYDLVNATITFIYEKITYNSIERSLRFYISELNNEIATLNKDIEILNSQVNIEENEEIKKQKQLKEEQKNNSKDLINEYRKQVSSLKAIFSPDKEQNKIKRSKLFNNPIIINGGPGTGKTTILIHRIQFLLSMRDKTLREDYKDEINVNVDFNKISAQDYLIFTPTKLLKEYLKQALSREGLSINNENLVVWNEFRNSVFRKFKYFSENGAFKNINNRNYDSILILNSKDLTIIENKYFEFVINQVKLRINNITQSNLYEFNWIAKASVIKRDIEALLKMSELNSFINNLRKIEEDYKADLELNNEGLSKIVKIATLEFLSKLKKSVDDLTWAIDFCNNDFDSLSNEEEEDALIEDELSLEDSENNEIEEDDYESKLKLFISRTIKLIALRTVDSNQKLTKRQLLFKERLHDYFKLQNLNEIGSMAYFSKIFQPFLKGPESIFLNSHSANYKKFRKSILFKDFVHVFDKDQIKNYIIDTSLKGKIHANEQELVLYLLLKLIRGFFKSSQYYFYNSKNKFINTFKDISKTIIAVDEATDYSLIQLQNITLISNPSYNCVTLCGDLMQRMVSHGISDWKEYLEINPEGEIFYLNTSYRQTPVLLGLAKKLYMTAIGRDSDYKSSKKLNFPHMPSPVFLVSDDFEFKINWVAKKIIYLMTKFEDNTLPNLTIFVRDSETAKDVTVALNENAKLGDLAINAVQCDEGKIDSSGNIRVFPIEFIKGLEFEGVFFWDIDKLSSSDDYDIERLIYIGISRASIYLGLIFNEEIPKPLIPFCNSFKDNWVTDKNSDLLFD